ncbi:hypothetical protein MMC22_004992 [Lobaria immixta]|nr:hypothetical protein [Lobaria immixta]
MAGSRSPLNVFNASSTSRPVVPQDNNAFADSQVEPPPLYSAVAHPQPAAGPSVGSDRGAPKKDDPFAFLGTFDTVFLIDDSGSMAGRSWREVAAALKSITPICTKHDADGIDIYFLNKADEPQFRQIHSPEEVDLIFSRVRPQASTPTGTRLNAILKPYLKDLEKRGEEVKPLNIIVITDGQPSDDPESVIINAAKKLDALEAPPWQVGIQFFQVGQEEGAAEALRDLDDALVERGGGIRDMVDTVPWSGTNGSGLNGEGIMKVVLGAVNRRLDRKRNSTEWRRR